MFGSNCAVLTMATGTGTVTLTGTNATTGEAVQQMADLDYILYLSVAFFALSLYFHV